MLGFVTAAMSSRPFNHQLHLRPLFALLGFELHSSCSSSSACAFCHFHRLSFAWAASTSWRSFASFFRRFSFSALSEVFAESVGRSFHPPLLSRSFVSPQRASAFRSYSTWRAALTVAGPARCSSWFRLLSSLSPSFSPSHFFVAVPTSNRPETKGLNFELQHWLMGKKR